MPKFCFDHLITKTICNYAVKNNLVFDSVSNRYKTQEICDKAVDDFAHEFKFVPEWYKAQ